MSLTGPARVRKLEREGGIALNMPLQQVVQDGLLRCKPGPVGAVLHLARSILAGRIRACAAGSAHRHARVWALTAYQAQRVLKPSRQGRAALLEKS